MTPHNPLRCLLCPEHLMLVSHSFLGQPWKVRWPVCGCLRKGQSPESLQAFQLESVLSAVVLGPGNVVGRRRS